MPWPGAGLGGHALVTWGLGDGTYVVVIDFWESPAEYQTRTGQRDQYAIMRSLQPRRKALRKARRHTGGG